MVQNQQVPAPGRDFWLAERQGRFLNRNQGAEDRFAQFIAQPRMFDGLRFGKSGSGQRFRQVIDGVLVSSGRIQFEAGFDCRIAFMLDGEQQPPAPRQDSSEVANHRVQ